MKKISLFILSGLVIASTALAQNPKKNKCNWGLKLGLNGSTIRMENSEEGGWKTGLVAGVFVKIRAGEKFSIQPEFLYSSMGSRMMNGGSETSVRLNYLSLPVLAQYNVTEKVSIFVGPQIDVLAKAKSKSNNNFSQETESYKENSINATGGISFWPLHCLGFSARYIHGLNNIAQTGSMKMKNQGVQFTAALNL
jgi:hypothetical protein